MPWKKALTALAVVTLVVAGATGPVAAEMFGNPNLCGDGGRWSEHEDTGPSILDVAEFLDGFDDEYSDPASYDFNCDGRVTILDVLTMLNQA
jgi:hypothetical protein